jgi:diaminopropionate ammonia-lyase
MAARDGNHDRAVAHVARLIGVPAQIFVPDSLTDAAKASIDSEGAQLTELVLERRTRAGPGGHRVPSGR